MPLYANLSKQMEDKAISVFKESKSNIFRLKCKIYSGINPTVVVKPMTFQTGNVIQQFEKEYMEKFTATLDISTEEAILLVGNATDLRATITLEHVTQHYYRIIDELDPQILQYKVIINSNVDLKKVMQKTELLTQSQEGSLSRKHTSDDIRSSRYQLQVEFVSDSSFEKRELPTNMVFKNTDIQSVVCACCAAMGIKSIDMVKSDCVKKWEHVIVPPMKTIGTLLDELQDTYGIYQKGIGFYFDEQTQSLKVFPEYDTNPSSSTREIHLYRLPKGCFPGCSSYHKEEGGNVHIVLTEEADMQNLSAVGTENVGNYQVTKRTDTNLDTDATFKGKVVEINKNNMLGVAAQGESTTTTGRVSTRHNQTSNNPLKMSSDMAGVMCVIGTTTWNMAWPWLFKIGDKIVYHYEEVGGLKTTTGILSAAEYSMTSIAGIMGELTCYAWRAKLAFRLTQDFQDEEKVTPDILANFKAQLDSQKK